MRLAKAQIEQCDRKGYLLFPELLSQAEIDALRRGERTYSSFEEIFPRQRPADGD